MLANIIIILVIAVIFGYCLKKFISEIKSGSCSGCGGNCAGCGHQCHVNNQPLGNEKNK